MTLPPIQWMTYIAAPIARVFRTLTTADGWDGWFTQGTSLEARVGGRIVMRWTEAVVYGAVPA